jgi:hypothetical protein
MTLFQRMIYYPDAAGGLCRTCTWGTVRVGYFRGRRKRFAGYLGLTCAYDSWCAIALTTAIVAFR